MSKKINRHVQFLFSFDMKPYFSSSIIWKRDGNRMFSFYVVTHSGMLESGHYVTYLHLRNQWYKCDDAWIIEVDKEVVKASYCYLMCYCRSEEVARGALKAGLQPSQIKLFGLLVRPSFVKPVCPKVELGKELEMEGHLPVVLLMGGGEGMGSIEATTRALADALYNERLGEPIGQVLVICGRNKKLADRLNSVDWKNPVQVKGFVTKMEECMGVCDCIITKVNFLSDVIKVLPPVYFRKQIVKREDDIRLTSKEQKETRTIAEPMIRGLTIILNGNIAGQEARNVPHVIENE
ncbi:hypothetical protein H5410_041657 [Solanum commersonii]|uniref:USP domain-containing protein n=1 Tax=Solanum commersonii TaxID=4109 RepID=A0A9J5XU74_SOLCO|nr:hypothetical protein H5410_041657 [Solanum commersonii]